MPTATLVVGPNKLDLPMPSIVETRDGLTGTAGYIVDSGLPEDAFGATGLPAYGDAWSVGLPSLTVSERSCTCKRAANVGEGHPGVTGVIVTYRTPSADGRLPAPATGTAFSVVTPQFQTVNTLWDVRNLLGSATPGPQQWPINGKAGTPIDVGYLQIDVYRVKAAGYSIPWSSLADAVHYSYVNADSLTLPAVQGSSAANISLAAGKARYRGFEITQVGTLLQIKHTLLVAPNHDVLWQPEDAAGNAVGSPVTAKVYRTQDLSTLLS